MSPNSATRFAGEVTPSDAPRVGDAARSGLVDPVYEGGDGPWNHHATAGVAALEPTMLVAVEATRLLGDVRGIGRYVRAMLPRLLASRPGLQLVLFVKRRRDVAELAAWLADQPFLRERSRVRHVRELRSSGADVYWYPWNVVDPPPKRGAVVVVTVHDVAPVALPDPRWRAWRKNLRWRWRYAAMARRADMLIADSHFTSDEIRRVLGVPRDRIRVVHLAADDRPVPAATDDRATLERLGVRRPYLLSVGADDRRKNLDLLQRVMDRLALTLPELTLVQVGPRRRSWLGSDPTQAATQTLGFVTDEALTALYRSAAALVMPSRYEGFGLPVLEAMRLGTPVICSRASSLPEVAGPAAAWVDPGDAEAFAKTITSVVTDGATSARMRAGGELRATLFSWDETARRTLQVFDEARRRAAALAWL